MEVQMAKYRQLKISVDPALAEAFKDACSKSGVSMASELTGFMRSRSGSEACGAPAVKAVDIASTRGHRRKAVRDAVAQLGYILAAEESYRDRIPENLMGSEAYEAADRAVNALEQAIDILSEAF
jgi:hypothetical protein